MELAKTNNKKIYVDDFETVLSYFKTIDSNWATNSLIVEFYDGSNQSVRGFIGVKNPNSPNQVLYGAMSWGAGANLEEIVFDITRITGGVTLFVSASITTLNAAQENICVRKFLKAALPGIHKKFIAKVLKKTGGGPRVHPLFCAHPRVTGPGGTVTQTNYTNYLFSRDFINMANDLAIHFN